MQGPDDALRLTRLAYLAVGDREAWTGFLNELGRSLGTGANTLYLKPRPFRPDAEDVDLFSFGLSYEWYRAYHDYYGRKNPALISCEHQMVEGSAYRDEALYPRKLLVTSEFYNDWIAPQKMAWALYGLAFKEKSRVLLINSVRFRGGRPFSDRDVCFMETLLPHIRQAVRLHMKIAELQRRAGAAEEALNSWPMGIILVDCHGRALLVNRSAERITRERDGIQLCADGLHAARAEQTIVLRSLIFDAVQVSEGCGLRPGGALALKRPSGKRALNVLVTPICSHASLCLQPGAAAIVLVSDPEAVEEAREDVLVRLFQFSRAEAGVAARLAHGKNVRDISEELHVSRNTLRTHLKRILEKTDTRRQAELVRLLLRSPASVFAAETTASVRAALKRSA